MLRKNIDNRGRWLRGCMGVALLGVAVVLFVWDQPWLGASVALGGLFALFEAAFAWCAARACGIKTRF